MADPIVDNQGSDPMAVASQLGAQQPAINPALAQLVQAQAQRDQQPQNMPSTPGNQRSGPRPILLDLIDSMRGQHNMSPASGGQQSQRQSRMQGFEGFLSNFIYALGQGMEQGGHGPGSFGRGFGAAVKAPMELGMQREAFQNQQAQQQAATQHTQAESGLTDAQANMYKQTVMTPYGPMNLMLAKTMFPSLVKQNIANQSDATKKLVAGFGQDGKPLPLEQLSLPQQMKAQATQLQMKLSNARLSAMNADPNTPAGQFAIARFRNDVQKTQSFIQRANAASQNAGTNYARYLGEYFYKDPQGNPLPGAYYDESGNLVPPKSPQFPTGNMRTMGQTAQTVYNHLDTLTQEVEDLGKKGKLGPVAGRMNELLAGKIGASDPDFAKFRADAGLGMSGVLRAHFGAKGGQETYGKFVSMLNAAGGDPENIKAAISSFQDWMGGYSEQGGTTPRGSHGRAPVPSGKSNQTTASPKNADDYLKKF